MDCMPNSSNEGSETPAGKSVELRGVDSGEGSAFTKLRRGLEKMFEMGRLLRGRADRGVASPAEGMPIMGLMSGLAAPLWPPAVSSWWSIATFSWTKTRICSASGLRRRQSHSIRDQVM